MSKSASEVYAVFCGYLDSKSSDYTRDDSNLAVTLKADCGGVVCPVFVQVDGAHERVSLIAVLPIQVTHENGKPLVECVTKMHRELAKGTFCIYPDDGRLTFESTDTFAGLSGIGEAFAENVLGAAVNAIIKYAATLAAVAEGKPNE